MKTLKLFIAAALFTSLLTTAQSHVIPSWGVPVTTQRYYYIPDIETYYDIPSRQYISLRNGVWVRSSTLPPAYRNYDLHRGRKIAINDYNGNAPYTYYNVHRVKYVPASRVYAKDKGHKHKSHGHAKGHYQGKGHLKGKGKGHAKHNH